ncbi:hypothetical protein LCGC14_0430090 [marine sediment metagenome]|uniref:Uncharacterized protein n=1 Tax=marine sediment metagenome TaxID=412755 RepID=A0A0F9VXX6_9ZZZZ
MTQIDIVKWSLDVPDSYKSPEDREYIEPDVLMRIGMYFLYGEDPGTILEYCFQDDWKRAIFGVVSGGGDITLEGLFGIGMLLTNRMPSMCQGSDILYGAWIKARGMNNIAIITQTHIVPFDGESIAYSV